MIINYKRYKKALFWIILFIVPLVFFMIVEMYVQMNHSHDDIWVLTGRKEGKPGFFKKWALTDAFCAYRAKPGIYYSGWRYGNKSVNSLGFISTPELEITKSPNTIRIAFLGGSSTAGTGPNLADEYTWPWLVWETLRNKLEGKKKIEFINAAIGGYSTFESYGRLWSRVRFLQPDIVVVYHGWNEMYYFDEIDELFSWKTWQDGSWSTDTHGKIKVYEPLWFDPFIGYSQLLTKIRILLSQPIKGEIGSHKNDFLTR